MNFNLDALAADILDIASRHGFSTQGLAQVRALLQKTVVQPTAPILANAVAQAAPAVIDAIEPIVANAVTEAAQTIEAGIADAAKTTRKTKS